MWLLNLHVRGICRLWFQTHHKIYFRNNELVYARRLPSCLLICSMRGRPVARGKLGHVPPLFTWRWDGTSSKTIKKRRKNERKEIKSGKKGKQREEIDFFYTRTVTRGGGKGPPFYHRRGGTGGHTVWDKKGENLKKKRKIKERWEKGRKLTIKWIFVSNKGLFFPQKRKIYCFLK